MPHILNTTTETVGNTTQTMPEFVRVPDVRIPTHFGQQSDFNRTVIRFNSDSRPI